MTTDDLPDLHIPDPTPFVQVLLSFRAVERDAQAVRAQRLDAADGLWAACLSHLDRRGHWPGREDELINGADGPAEAQHIRDMIDRARGI